MPWASNTASGDSANECLKLQNQNLSVLMTPDDSVAQQGCSYNYLGTQALASPSSVHRSMPKGSHSTLSPLQKTTTHTHLLWHALAMHVERLAVNIGEMESGDKGEAGLASVEKERKQWPRARQEGAGPAQKCWWDNSGPHHAVGELQHYPHIPDVRGAMLACEARVGRRHLGLARRLHCNVVDRAARALAACECSRLS